MKMALPRGMYPHPKTGVYWVRKDVPKSLQKLVGQTSLKQSLGTKDRRKADLLYHDVMKRFIALIDVAKTALAAGTLMPIDYSGVRIEVAPEFQAGVRAKFELSPQGQIARIREELSLAGLSRTKLDPVSVEALFARWKAERQPTKNSIMEYERAKDAFIQINGDLPISEYTSAHARAWKDHVVAMTGITHATRVKWFGSIRTLFRLADRNELLNTNPFAKIILEKPRNATTNIREEWEPGELTKLFQSSVFVAHERPRGGAGEAAFWLPVLALYHGFRAGELCQLDTADVVTRSGIVCLKISPSGDDDRGKSVKTAESIRTVPLHKTVIDLGFLEYLAQIRRAKQTKLFPKITRDKHGRWSAKWSKWFGRYRRGIGLGGRWRDFHSLRHGWKSAARSAGIPREFHAEISGHDTGDVGDTYGHVPISRLKAELDKVTFGITIPKWNVQHHRSLHQ